MTVAAADLLAYVKAGNSDTEFASSCIVTASALVAAQIGSATVPEAIIDRAVIECAAELFARRGAPSGVSQFAQPDGGAGPRLARDPMTGARTILRPFLPVGFGAPVAEGVTGLDGGTP